MSRWINAEYHFNPRYKTFYIDRLQSRGSNLEQLLNLMGGNPTPQALEEWCELAIERARPELRGACIWHLGWSPTHCRWEFTISHPSLPEVPMGECSPTERLIP